MSSACVCGLVMGPCVNGHARDLAGQAGPAAPFCLSGALFAYISRKPLRKTPILSNGIVRITVLVVFVGLYMKQGRRSLPCSNRPLGLLTKQGGSGRLAAR